MIPIKKGDYKLIAFGEDFDELKPEHKMRYLMELCSSQNHALDLMQNERNDLAKEANQLKALLTAAQQGVDIIKTTLQKTISENNSREQAFIKDIQELNKQIKQMETKS